MRPVLLSLSATAGLLIASAPSVAGLRDVAGNPLAGDFFVSPQGKDTWAGKLADPGKDDGPFATVARAGEPSGPCLRPWTNPDPSASSCVPGHTPWTGLWSSGPRIPGPGTPPWSMPRRRARRSP